MKLKTMIAAVALATAAVGAHADDVSQTLTFDSTKQSYKASFFESSAFMLGNNVLSGGSDVFSFTLPVSAISGTYHVVASFVGVGANFDWGLTNLNGVTGSPILSGPGYDFGEITANTSSPFVLTIYGTSVGNDLHLISGRLDATLLPVPEPESYAMLLAGLGLMGTIARRRSNKKSV